MTPNTSLKPTPGPVAAFGRVVVGAAYFNRYVSLAMRTTLQLPVLAAFIFSFSVRATEIEPKPLSEIVERSRFIGVVLITGSSVRRTTSNGESTPCGVVYEADVLDAIKGPSSMVSFFATDHLLSGERYVTFLTDGDTASTNMSSWSSFGIPEERWRKLQEGLAREKLCRSQHAGLKALDGLTDRVVGPARDFPEIGALDQWWVEYTPYVADQDVLSIVAKDVVIEHKGITSEERRSKLYTYEDYPRLDFTAAYATWAQYRAAIAAAMGK